MTAPEVPVRPAATIVLWRKGDRGPRVLMGQRGRGAVFMPSKYVFPGGAVDAADRGDGACLAPECRARLAAEPLAAPAPDPGALAAAALRELAEETGLALAPATPLRFFFRAVTPPGSPRRFDARFFLAPASGLTGDPDDFSRAEAELSHLHWIGLDEARALDLPFITEVVLSETAALLRGEGQPGVPFFDNYTPVPTFRRIRG